MPGDAVQIKPIFSTELHMFWAYGSLSRLERLCISSFVHNQFSITLWTYGAIANAPYGVKVRNARDVLPEERCFLNRAGSYASFADLFRYTVLNTLGGLYADTDVIALIPFTSLPMRQFLVTERQHLRDDFLVNNNVIFNPTPTPGNIIDLACAVADRFPPQKISWSQIGPPLLTSLVQIQHEHDFYILPPDYANPVAWWDCPAALLTPGAQLPAGAGFLHCYNESWRRAKIDKEAPYPHGSLMDYYEKIFMAG